MAEGGEYEGSREEGEGSGGLHGEQWSIALRLDLALAISRGSCQFMKVSQNVNVVKRQYYVIKSGSSLHMTILFFGSNGLYLSR